MSDPTQEGGQEVKPTLNPRHAAMAQIAQQAHEAQANDLSSFDEDTGEIEAKPAKEEPEQVQEQEPAKVEEPAKKKYSLIVDGTPVEVDEDKIIEAGRRTLQKETAADRRLQEAQRLKQQAEELLNKAKSSGPSQEDAQAERQPAQAIEGLTPETLPTLLQGLEQRVISTLDAKQAVQKFREEFSDIASDPDLWQLAVARNQQRIDHAAAVGEPLGDDLAAYRKIGQELRSKFAQKAVEIPADKLEKKRTITAIPAVNARTPAPQEQNPKSTSEQIEELRKLRAQGYRTQGFSRLRSQ